MFRSLQYAGAPQNRAPLEERWAGELQIREEVQADIDWDAQVFRLRPHKGAQYLGAVAHRGIYIVELDGKPVLVGVAWQSSIGRRWRDRLTAFRELKIPGALEKRYTVRVGRIAPTGTWTGPGHSDQDLYETVERVLIRYLKKVRRYGLTNIRSSVPFTVAAQGILIRNQGSKPAYLPVTIRRSLGQILEIDAT